MTDDVLAAQVGYYRHRASEYDVTAYGDVDAARRRIARLVAQVQPSGRVLEIACGTGLWTEALARLAGSLVAIDAAPETLAIARERVPAANVRFEVADVFTWTTDDRFDVIFFSAWLSHVPQSRFDEFWRTLGDLLAVDGRVVFVDEPVDVRAKETYVPDAEEIVERCLEDGRTFQIVKNFLDPQTLPARLRALGWECHIVRDDGDSDGDAWIVGEAVLDPSAGTA